MNTKLSGFTLLETMVSIIIASLLILFTFSMYRSFHQYYVIYTKQTKEINQLVFFKRQLNNDCNKSVTMYGEDKKVTFFVNEKPINYLFTDSTIVRQTKGKSTIFSFVTKSVNLIPLENSTLLKQVTINLDEKSQIYTLTLSKSYGIKNQINESLKKQENSVYTAQ